MYRTARPKGRIQSLGLCGWVSTHLKKTPNNPIKHIISFGTQELNQLSESSRVRESEKRKRVDRERVRKGFSVCCSAAAVNKMQTKLWKKEALDLGKHGGASRAPLCNCPAWLAISSLVQDQSLAEIP